MSNRTPTDGAEALPVDERLIMPESRHEVVDGRVVYVSPADPPHASRHSKLSALLEAYAREGYDAASDMLTRTSPLDDMAPDGSIYSTAPDPATGGRQLEELAFEVVSTERLSAAATKARSLVKRGVRRVFAIDVQRERGLEFSRETDGWEILAPDAHIDDPVLVIPLPIYDLVAAGKADDAVARALLAKRNPVLMAALEAERDTGLAAGKAEAVLAVLAARAISVDDAQRAAILGTTELAQLERMLIAAATCAAASALFE